MRYRHQRLRHAVLQRHAGTCHGARTRAGHALHLRVGTIGEDIAVLAMKSDAQDYVLKGSLKRLVPAVQRELRELREAETRKEQRCAEVERHVADARFCNVLDTAADAVIVTDEDQRIQVYSQGAEQGFGYRAEEVVGQP
ncbi:MAG: PAS domain-containing protein [Acidiferrobacterales bacterium]